MKINLGCGKTPKIGYCNVDLIPYPGVDLVADLKIFPWKWASGSIDAIYANHVLEHFLDQEKFIKECHRILKKKGMLHIGVPHISALRALGDMGHYRGYSVKTFDQYLCQAYYWFDKPAFRTLSQKITYIAPSASWWIQAIHIITLPVERCINLCPELYEKITHCYLGGAQSVEWIGEKL